MSLLDNMPHTCTARRRVRTSDGEGGYVDSFATLFSDRSCWRQAASDQEVEWWQQRQQSVTDKVYFAADPGLDVGCVLDFGGLRWDVVSQAVPDSSVGLGLLWRIMTRYTGQIGETA